MLSKKSYIILIPGTRKVDRLSENADASDILLTGAEVNAIDKTLDTSAVRKLLDG